MRNYALAVLLATFSLPFAVNADDADFRAQCEKFATEDRVAADEKEAYMKDCIVYLTEEQNAGEDPDEAKADKEGKN
ncbi:MAG: hypothetical protein A2286_12915 [Gammaproteobacteria bacterium RIFOXYA12_FULL_61_12]|nr:MAG: hypothetical protein A2514_13820 [Gammaproteobacteria bacterium RIFOXYD12_FULL_61_37]OGT92003.1 MAG: hypothetical protein A2286_12915 [Gammaproteobacteria bacterium RIFOXYA12_FULL_61_12]